MNQLKKHSKKRLKLMLLLGMKHKVILYLRYNGLTKEYLN